jgi:hypothetical protein
LLGDAVRSIGFGIIHLFNRLQCLWLTCCYNFLFCFLFWMITTELMRGCLLFSGFNVACASFRFHEMQLTCGKIIFLSLLLKDGSIYLGLCFIYLNKVSFLLIPAPAPIVYWKLSHFQEHCFLELTFEENPYCFGGIFL